MTAVTRNRRPPRGAASPPVTPDVVIAYAEPGRSADHKTFEAAAYLNVQADKSCQTQPTDPLHQTADEPATDRRPCNER